MRKSIGSLPIQFRVLYRQFLLRVVDLEALSVQADIPRFLGQFASILIFVSLIGAFGLLSAERATATPEGYLNFTWQGEESLIAGMMLVIGLVTVISWDSTFPDRRDVMVLSPLPIRPRTVLLAKISASASLLGLAILTLNCATGIAWPLLIGAHHDSIWGFFQAFAAYWSTMIAASAFIFCSVLTVQGLCAWLLPRRIFLASSAVLQLVAFGIFLGGYFLVPSITPSTMLAAAENHAMLAWSPQFWFFALFNQLNGSLPHQLSWLALRAWIGLSSAALGTAASLSLCYFRTMNKTVEEPDLVPGSRGFHWAPSFGNSLRTSIVMFSLRSLVRSRQHRLAFVFYLAIVFSIALSWLRVESSIPAPAPLSGDFLSSTLVMMSLAVFGLRSVFSLPISLHANWMLRTTQIAPSEKYVAATRWALVLLAVFPVWLISALLSLSYRPLHSVFVHLVLLGLLGWVFVEVSLINFYKVPFTCSYLPGKVHVQVVFWCFLLLMFVFSLVAAEIELPSLGSATRSLFMILGVVVSASGFLIWNQRRAKSAVLYFEELAPDAITSLGLVWIPETTTGIGGRRSIRER
ncbi:MAG TPA: hypothetical protein VGS27_34915 [Candidatus Sulfotelmatobacter sp.]|nr:hypothetical protein [Candidatus Sulfotelmatobacter sp.]